MCKTVAVIRHIAQMTQDDNELSAFERTLRVAESVDAHYFPHTTDPLVCLYMKPINDNDADNEALKAMLRVVTLSYKMFAFSPKSRNGAPSECVMCKADTHLEYLCPLAHPYEVNAGEEWWGPPDQMSKLTEGVLAVHPGGGRNNNSGGGGGNSNNRNNGGGGSRRNGGGNNNNRNTNGGRHRLHYRGPGSAGQHSWHVGDQTARSQQARREIVFNPTPRQVASDPSEVTGGDNMPQTTPVARLAARKGAPVLEGAVALPPVTVPPTKVLEREGKWLMAVRSGFGMATNPPGEVTIPESPMKDGQTQLWMPCEHQGAPIPALMRNTRRVVYFYPQPTELGMTHTMSTLR
ncbi:hypothetical protein FB451DRAFT_1460192 [Mycena latifolia]|nr:hypothetical protein FB451DRAFT_1460192 [Mycena latifolia]